MTGSEDMTDATAHITLLNMGVPAAQIPGQAQQRIDYFREYMGLD